MRLCPKSSEPGSSSCGKGESSAKPLWPDRVKMVAIGSLRRSSRHRTLRAAGSPRTIAQLRRTADQFLRASAARLRMSDLLARCRRTRRIVAQEPPTDQPARPLGCIGLERCLCSLLLR
jgi:hypothetical protein